MVVIVKIINAVFTFLFFPFSFFSPLWELIFISIITGILMLIIFKYTSDQKAIKSAKNKIQAYIYELVLYKDSLETIMKALGNIAKYNFVYLKQMIFPLLFLIFPVFLILIQLNFRYQFRPFKLNESTLVKVKVNKNIIDNNVKIELKSSEGVKIETPVLRIPKENELNWRIKVNNPGIHKLVFDSDSELVEKKLEAGQKQVMLAPKKVNRSFLNMIFNPGEEPIPKNSIFESIEVKYPKREMIIFRMKVHWLIIFFVVSLVAAFTLKNLFRVEL